MPLQATTAVRWMQKEGHSSAEYKDAWSIEPTTAVARSVSAGSLRVAVADGASEGFLSGRWASALTSAFAAAATPALLSADEFIATATSVAAQWPLEIKRYTVEREARSRPLKWNERASLARGSSATLLALHASWSTPGHSLLARLFHGKRPRPGRWHAVAFGDTCIFQVGADTLKKAFPLTRYTDFDTTPPLLNTNVSQHRPAVSRVQLVEGTFTRGDSFYLCTDALAAWFLQQDSAGNRPWKVLNALDEADFEPWLRSVRQARLIRNDDVTMIRIAFW